jgi:hypothetical protein
MRSELKGWLRLRYEAKSSKLSGILLTVSWDMRINIYVLQESLKSTYGTNDGKLKDVYIWKSSPFPQKLKSADWKMMEYFHSTFLLMNLNQIHCRRII